MKKTLSILGVAALSVICSGNANAQDMEKFKADMGKKSVMGKEVRVPYTDVITYYGYVKPGAKPDEEKGGKKYYYLYVWIPAVAPEIGIRMISPVPAKMTPEKEDFQAADYDANKADTKNFFDTWISFEKAEGVTSAADIATKGKTAKWNQIDSNDDSSEMPAQPSGSKYNSMMRITSEVSNPLKALTVGLYRIGFTTYKTGEVQGSFAAQLGSPVKLPGTKVAPTLELLAK
ncbi:MAG: LipL32 family surface lipoprotein [Bacteroidota bacterium]